MDPPRTFDVLEGCSEQTKGTLRDPGAGSLRAPARASRRGGHAVTTSGAVRTGAGTRSRFAVFTGYAPCDPGPCTGVEGTEGWAAWACARSRSAHRAGAQQASAPPRVRSAAARTGAQRALCTVQKIVCSCELRASRRCVCRQVPQFEGAARAGCRWGACRHPWPLPLHLHARCLHGERRMYDGVFQGQWQWRRIELHDDLPRRSV